MHALRDRAKRPRNACVAPALLYSDCIARRRLLGIRVLTRAPTDLGLPSPCGWLTLASLGSSLRCRAHPDAFGRPDSHPPLATTFCSPETADAAAAAALDLVLAALSCAWFLYPVARLHFGPLGSMHPSIKFLRFATVSHKSSHRYRHSTGGSTALSPHIPRGGGRAWSLGFTPISG